MTIAFEINCLENRDTIEDAKILLEFLKILKRAGHYIIVWARNKDCDIELFVKKSRLSGYIDEVTTKNRLKARKIDLIFACGTARSIGSNMVNLR